MLWHMRVEKLKSGNGAPANACQAGRPRRKAYVLKCECSQNCSRPHSQCIGLYVCAERKDSLRIQLLSVERENFSIQSMKPMTLLKGDIEECDSPDEATEQRAREQAKSCKPSKEPR